MTCPFETRRDSGRPGRERSEIAKPAAGPAENRSADGRVGTGAQAPVPFEISETEASACRALWCAVLVEHWNLSIAPLQIETDLEVWRAKKWFGSTDFYMVCDLAGVDGRDVLSAWQAAQEPGTGFRLAIQKQSVIGTRRPE